MKQIPWTSPRDHALNFQCSWLHVWNKNDYFKRNTHAYLNEVRNTLCCVFSILDPLALQKAHFNFSYGIWETLVTIIKKKPHSISYFNMGLSFSLTANSWLHIRCSRNPLDLSDMIKAAGFQQHQLPYLFAHLLCVPRWFCTPVGCDIFISLFFFSEPVTCRTPHHQKGLPKLSFILYW